MVFYGALHNSLPIFIASHIALVSRGNQLERPNRYGLTISTNVAGSI